MKVSFPPLPLAVLAPLLLAIVSPSTSQTEETYVGHVCFDTSNSTSRANLHSAVSSLSSQKGVSNGFYRFSNGENVEDPVNVYALCRGDISESACRSCVTFAASQRCPVQAEEAIAWYDNCMLRYSTSHNFSYVFPLHNMYTGDLLRGPVVSSSLLGSYFDARDDLLSTLAKRASLGDSTRKFATGNISFTTSDQIYALVQCVPDLNETQCGQCLQDQAAKMPFPLLQQWRALATACDLRLATTQFYNIAGNAPEPSKDVIIPKDKSHPYIAVIIVVMSACFILLVASVCIFLCLMRRKEKLQNRNNLGNTAPSPPGLQAIRVDGDEQRQAGRGARSATNSVTPIMEMPILAAQRSETGVSSNYIQDGTSMSWILKTPLTHPAPR